MVEWSSSKKKRRRKKLSPKRQKDVGITLKPQELVFKLMEKFGAESNVNFGHCAKILSRYSEAIILDALKEIDDGIDHPAPAAYLEMVIKGLVMKGHVTPVSKMNQDVAKEFEDLIGELNESN